MKSSQARIFARAWVAGFVYRRPFGVCFICRARRATPTATVRPGHLSQKSHIVKNPRTCHISLQLTFEPPDNRPNMSTSTQALRSGASGLTTPSSAVRCSNGLGCLVSPLYRRQRSAVSQLPTRGTFVTQCCSDRHPRRPRQHQEVRLGV